MKNQTVKTELISNKENKLKTKNIIKLWESLKNFVCPNGLLSTFQ